MGKRLAYAEYIWIDGAKPVQQMRSKTKIIFSKDDMNINDFPEWSFDGSSTWQAKGHSSDCLLRPVFFIKDPLREGEAFLVLCEVFNGDGSIHPSNKRAELRKAMENFGKAHDPYIGYEQEYTFVQGQNPLGWPDRGYPAPQGPFYCGVGAENVFGREIVEDHMAVCMAAGLNLYGINAEVMPGQWEFQIGYRGDDSEKCDPVTMADHTWMARFLLYFVGEKYNVRASLDPKPVKGDWNGSGMHTNFSTKDMRTPEKGKVAMQKAIDALSKNHARHIADYGHNLHERLTGMHETCHITEFRAGESDRGASIRIPLSVRTKGYGYLEDRRPGANADPYVVATRLVETICGNA